MDHDPSLAADTVRDSTVTAQRIFIRDLVVTSVIGYFKREQVKAQRLVLNLELCVQPPPSYDDHFSDVVDYGRLVRGIRQTCEANTAQLLETLADHIARFCLVDPRVLSARVRVEKLDLYPDAAGVGIEIERHRRQR